MQLKLQGAVYFRLVGAIGLFVVEFVGVLFALSKVGVRVGGSRGRCLSVRLGSTRLVVCAALALLCVRFIDCVVGL